MNYRLPRLLFVITVPTLLMSCGGGGDSEQASAPTSTHAHRIAAATATANHNPACAETLLGAYYWEIGDKTGRLASGTMGASVTEDTPLNIASASKWMFAAYVLEKHADWANSVSFLNFTSGYSNFSNLLCLSGQTVAECMNGGVNAAEAAAGTFHYQGGHMQQLAVNLGLGPLRNDGLAEELRGALGKDIELTFVSPQPPGGVRTTARSYATFLRKLLVGTGTPLRLGNALGTHAVCTKGTGCNAALHGEWFIPEPFHYSLGHWVENNPETTPSSNFAYSSAGAFGFYPWIDFDRTYYGLIARENQNLTIRQGYASLQCGRLIRLAWKTGVQQ